MTIPRCIHRLYANVFGYFWLPCPICKVPFGGHEWRSPRAMLITERTGGGATGVGVCQDCVEDAKAINLERWGVER